MTIIFVTFCGNSYGITVQRGGICGGSLPPPQKKNITRYKLNYLHHVRTQCEIWCIHVPVRPPSKISTAVKTTCERIVPSTSFLGAVYNHGRLYVVMKFTGCHWLALAPRNYSRPLNPNPNPNTPY